MTSGCHGRGYQTREVDTFGAPFLDAEANREPFEEQLQLLLKCCNEAAFHHKGKCYEYPPLVDYRGYRLKDITMVPRPKHLPVDIRMPIASPKTIETRTQGDGDAQRQKDPRRRRACLSRRLRPPWPLRPALRIKPAWGAPSSGGTEEVPHD
jgi:hypothetical protein